MLPLGYKDVLEVGEVHIDFCWGDLTEGNHLENLGVVGGIILKGILETLDGGHVLD